MILLWFVAGPICAQTTGYSVDIELIRPSFGADSVPGLDLPGTDRPGTVRAGLVAQYLDDPLTMYDAVSDRELGSVVARRATTALGLSADLSRSLSLRGVLPGATSWGSEVPEFSGDGTALGDLALGASWFPLRTGFSLGGRADLRLPTGRANAWVSERGVRVEPALVASVEVGALAIGSEGGLLLRPPLATSEELDLGPEVRWTSAARLALPDATRIALTSTLAVRSGLDPLGGTSVEALAGLQLRPSRDLTVDLAGGRGLTEGYGTTDLRLLSEVRARFRSRQAPPEVAIAPPPPPPPPELADLPDPEPPVDFGGHQAVVTPDAIALAQQPRFEVDTARLLPESAPLIAEVAQRFLEHPEIAQVVIEGHASQEGSFAHNYDLSLRRANAILQALVEAGVDGDRLSIRARGEVEPLVPGTDEEALQRNRRVEFRIVRRWEPDAIPAAREAQPLPWTGELRPVTRSAATKAGSPD